MEMTEYQNELLKKDDKLIESFVWVDMFIMVFLWVFGTFTVTKLSMRLFDPLNVSRTFFSMLLNVTGQLFFISTAFCDWILLSLFFISFCIFVLAFIVLSLLKIESKTVLPTDIPTPIPTPCEIESINEGFFC